MHITKKIPSYHKNNRSIWERVGVETRLCGKPDDDTMMGYIDENITEDTENIKRIRGRYETSNAFGSYLDTSTTKMRYEPTVSALLHHPQRLHVGTQEPQPSLGLIHQEASTSLVPTPTSPWNNMRDPTPSFPPPLKIMGGIPMSVDRRQSTSGSSLNYHKVDGRTRNKYYDVCNNCGKQGHTFKQCKNPITSFGVIVFRIHQNQRQYLMIRRKDTLGYIDFMRGKYSVSNHNYILNMLKQMTIQEKHKLMTYTFDELWKDLWDGDGSYDVPSSKNSTVPTTRPSTLSENDKTPYICGIPSEDDEEDEEKHILDPLSSLNNPPNSDVVPDSQWNITSRVGLAMPTYPDVCEIEIRRSLNTISDMRGPSVPVWEPGSTEQSSSLRSDSSLNYRQEESNSREKFNYLSSKIMGGNSANPHHMYILPSGQTILQYLLMVSNIPDIWKCEADPIPHQGGGWSEPEWGFPKGRRNFQEKDYECALREMTEETGYPAHLVQNIKNILPFDEIFMGSNYKSYKHRYYLMYMNYEDSLMMDNFEKSEVSRMEWKSYEECMEIIRPYNLEKKRLITQIEHTLLRYRLFL